MLYVVRTWKDARAVLNGVEEGAADHCLSVERHTDGSAYIQHIRLGVRIFVEEYDFRPNTVKSDCSEPGGREWVVEADKTAHRIFMEETGECPWCGESEGGE